MLWSMLPPTDVSVPHHTTVFKSNPLTFMFSGDPCVLLCVQSFVCNDLAVMTD